MARIFIMLGSLFMFSGVGAGAFGAHALKEYFSKHPELESTYQTAVQYHLLHGLALIGVAYAYDKWPTTLTSSAGILITIGLLIFSGSLYALVATRIKILGAITPIGGVAFLIGWFCLFLVAFRNA